MTDELSFEETSRFLDTPKGKLHYHEVGIFQPPARPGAPTGTIQMNDVFVDEREIVYAVDRHIGGLYTLEMDF